MKLGAIESYRDHRIFSQSAAEKMVLVGRIYPKIDAIIVYAESLAARYGSQKLTEKRYNRKFQALRESQSEQLKGGELWVKQNSVDMYREQFEKIASILLKVKSLYISHEKHSKIKMTLVIEHLTPVSIQTQDTYKAIERTRSIYRTKLQVQAWGENDFLAGCYGQAYRMAQQALPEVTQIINKLSEILIELKIPSV